MKPSEIASMLNGRQYMNEITGAEEGIAKALGMVIMFGYSDDNVEIRGDIDEEISAWNGRIIHLTESGLLINQCDDEDCPYFKEAQNKAVKIDAIWGKGGYSWTFEAHFPHETFDIFEGDDKFCRGIVFWLKDIREISK